MYLTPPHRDTKLLPHGKDLTIPSTKLFKLLFYFVCFFFRNVDIYFGSTKVQLKAEATGEKVYWDGAVLPIPANQNQVEIIKVGHYTILTHSTLGFKVLFVIYLENLEIFYVYQVHVILVCWKC